MPGQRTQTPGEHRDAVHPSSPWFWHRLRASTYRWSPVLLSVPNYLYQDPATPQPSDFWSHPGRSRPTKFLPLPGFCTSSVLAAPATLEPHATDPACIFSHPPPKPSLCLASARNTCPRGSLLFGGMPWVHLPGSTNLGTMVLWIVCLHHDALESGRRRRRGWLHALVAMVSAGFAYMKPPWITLVRFAVS